MQPYNIFLDAELLPRQVTWMNLPDFVWTPAKSFDEFTNLILKNGLPKTISFGNDFTEEHYGRYLLMKAQPLRAAQDFSGLKEKCGVHCAQWLTEFCYNRNAYLPFFHIHTKNEFAESAIRKILQRYQKPGLKLASKTQKIVYNLRSEGPVIEVRSSVKSIPEVVPTKIEIGKFAL